MNRIGCIDIGGTKIASAFIVESDIKDRRIIQTPKDNPDSLIDAIANLLEDWDYESIAIATGGLYRNGALFSISKSIFDWNGFPFEDRLKSKLNYTGNFVVENDGIAATWAEFIPRRQRFSSLCYITISTGIGGGFVFNNKIFKSHNGIAGHIGHIKVSNKGQCGCGRIGCVEAISSGTSIALAGTQLSGKNLKTIDVFKLAKLDFRYSKIIDKAVFSVVEMIGNISFSISPECYVIGGSTGLNDLFYNRLKIAITKLPNILNPLIEKSTYSADAPLIGVAKIAENY